MDIVGVRQVWQDFGCWMFNAALSCQPGAWRAQPPPPTALALSVGGAWIVDAPSSLAGMAGMVIQHARACTRTAGRYKLHPSPGDRDKPTWEMCAVQGLRANGALAGINKQTAHQPKETLHSFTHSIVTCAISPVSARHDLTKPSAERCVEWAWRRRDRLRQRFSHLRTFSNM